MKKLFLLTAVAMLLVSCQITERFYLNENGSVKYETELNFSDMMSFMYDEASKDSLRQIGEFPIDTVMNFADLENFGQLSSDSISDAEREFMKSMNKTKVRMTLNDTEGKMIIGIEETSIEKFNSYLGKVNQSLAKLESEDPKAAGELAQSGMMKTMEFKFDGKSFQRISNNSDMNALFDELDDSTAEATKQMMNMFEYKMEYHFPKKIKSSTIENASFSIDGKTMTVDVPMNELMENPEKYNFKVEFE